MNRSPDWDRLEDLFERAQTVDPNDRSAWLDDQCAGDPELRAELVSLLASAPGASSYLRRLSDELVGPGARGLLDDASPTTPDTSDPVLMGHLLEGGSEDPHQLDRLKAALADQYALEHELGAGGMATVYLAHDIKHNRKVAVKVLRPELAAVLGAGRFLKEIEVTANLHHPNIVQLYDSGEADGDLYYVMPYVDGESLREKIDRERQLSVEEAVSITRAVADALDYAHRRGVVHRDIKPDNIMLQEGKPLVSDFGIALAVSQSAGERITETGLSLGTPSYMSPEQATGDRELTARSDVYALGSVLYEMLAGDPPFMGTNVQAVIAKVVGEKPGNLRVVRDTVPPNVEAAVDKALAKVAADRFASAKAFADALVTETPVTRVEEAPAPSGWWSWQRGFVVAAAVGGVVVLALVVTGDDSPAGDTTASAIRPLTSYAGWEADPSWSPDGSMITYMHVAGGDADVATLSLGGGDPLILTGQSPADETNPRWSPDGSKIAFVSDRGAGTDVYWIPPTGGAERKLAETNIPALERLGAWAGSLGAQPWSPDGQELVYSRLHPTGEVALWKVNLASREVSQLTSPPPGAEDVDAAWSADGERIVFTRGAKGKRSLWLVPAVGGEAVPFLNDEFANMQAAWFPDSRRLAFLSSRLGRGLWEIDVGTGDLRRLTAGAVGNDGGPAVASNGTIAYHNWDHEIDIYRVNPDAPTEAHERLTAFTQSQFGARVSPDGGQVLYASNRMGPFDLWLLDESTGQHRQLTDDPASNRLPDWSPDGEEVVFLSNRGGAVRLWVVQAETGAVRQLTDHELPWASHLAEGQGGPRWAPDGSAIGYLAPEEGDAIWLVAPDGSDRQASSVKGVLSFGFYRDGRRVVYTRSAPDGSGLVELRAAHLGTGEDVLLRAGAIAEVDVAPDGSALTFIEAVSHFTMELYMLRLAEPVAPGELPRTVGEPKRLTQGNGVWHVHAGSWAPDGSGVVYSRDRDFGDIYLIEPNRREPPQ